jgi:phosphate transport system substrate-binding protein
LALIVNKDNPVTDLTLEQIKDIYSGNITNWSQVGGNDSAISLFNREDGSGTLEVFREKVLEKQNGKNGVAYNSSSAIIDAVGYDKNAIGYVSFSAVNNKVKYLKIDGTELTVSNIKNNKYPLVRPLYYVYNSSLPLSDQAQGFLDFVLSEEGQRIIATHGYAPIN